MQRFDDNHMIGSSTASASGAAPRGGAPATEASTAAAYLRPPTPRELGDVDADPAVLPLPLMLHEIRAPLQSIVAAFDALQLAVGAAQGDRREAREAQAELVQAGQRAARHLTELLDRLRAHPHLTVANHALEAEPFDLLDTIDEVLEIVTPHAELHGIEIDFSLRTEIEVRLVDDRLRLKQAILNLVRNGLRRALAGDGASKFVALQLGLAEQRPDWFELAIVDNGPALPADIAGRIFEPFAQPHDSAEDGRGLGLAIARHYIEMMGGRVEFAPTADGCCRFLARWPVNADRGRALPLRNVVVTTPDDAAHEGLRNMLASLGARLEPLGARPGQTVMTLAGRTQPMALPDGALVIEVPEPLSSNELTALLEEVHTCEQPAGRRADDRGVDPHAAARLGALFAACDAISSEFGHGAPIAQLQLFLAIALDRFRGETTLMSELSGRLGLHRRTVSRHLAGLGRFGTAHRRGLDLIRTAPSYDNRTKTITLNQAGESLADRLVSM